MHHPAVGPIRPILVALAVSMVVAGPLRASEIADRMVAAWTEWAGARGIAHGQLAVAFEGRIMAQATLDGRTGPVDLASLSKAITGICVTGLIERGMLGWSDTVGRHLPDAAAPLAGVRLADLVTHSSGLDHDVTQGRMQNWRGPGEPVHARIVQEIESQPLAGPQFRYNNANYAVLAEVISAVSGRSYAETCRDVVFAPPGRVQAGPSPLYGRFAAWGGWRASLADYARMIWHHYAADDPAEFPAADMGNGMHYGRGMVWRNSRDGGHNHWHFGALCFGGETDFMTFSVLWSNGWGAAVHVAGCPQDDWFATLDAALIGAVFR